MEIKNIDTLNKSFPIKYIYQYYFFLKSENIFLLFRKTIQNMYFNLFSKMYIDKKSTYIFEYFTRLYNTCDCI